MAWSQMQDVQLTEVSGPDDAAGRAGSDADASTGPGRGRPSLRTWGAVVAGLVLVLAGGPVVAGQRERTRIAQLAELPGVLAPVDAGMSEHWRRTVGWSQLDNLRGNILLFEPGSDGIEVESVDAATGASRWTTVLPGVTPTGDVWCVAPGPGPGHAALLACRVVTATVTDSVTGFSRPEGPVRLLVLDAGTGERLAERDLDGDGVAVEPFGPDLILTQVLPDGHAQVSRQDPITGVVRWTFRSPSPVGPAGSDELWLSPRVEQGVIIVDGPVTWAFAHDGAVLGEWHLRAGRGAARAGWWLELSVLPDGRFAVGESGGVRADDAYGTVSAGSARDGFEIAGPVLAPTVDDGSAAELVLTTAVRGGRVRAQDTSTGRVVWESDLAPDSDSIVLDRRLIATGRGRLTALDTRTGSVLWEVPIAAATRAAPIQTDGRVIVVAVLDEAYRPLLAAFDPADGRRLWVAPLDGPLEYLTTVDGTLLARSEQSLVAFG